MASKPSAPSVDELFGPADPEPSINQGTHDLAEKSAPAPTTATYPLPGGGEYIARKLPPYDNDVEGLRAMCAWQGSHRLQRHPMLMGEPGTGKTALVNAAFPNAVTIIMNSRTTAQQLTMTAYIDPETQRPVQGPGPLVRAATAGVPLYVDEIMLASPDALTPLYAAMDGRGWLFGANPDGSDVEIQPGFCVIGSSNPLVRGAFLPDAIASRFRILNVETSEELMVALGINATLRTIWKSIRTEPLSWYPSVRTLLSAQRELEIAQENDWQFQQVWAALTGPQIPAKDRDRVAGICATLLGVRINKTDYNTGLSIR